MTIQEWWFQQEKAALFILFFCAWGKFLPCVAHFVIHIDSDTFLKVPGNDLTFLHLHFRFSADTAELQ